MVHCGRWAREIENEALEGMAKDRRILREQRCRLVLATKEAIEHLAFLTLEESLSHQFAFSNGFELRPTERPIL